MIGRLRADAHPVGESGLCYPHPDVKRLDPKLDVVFKLLFTRKQQLLVDMLEGVLARPVSTVTVLNPGIPGELAHDKEIVLDIRVELTDGSRVDVEMQARVTPALTYRLVFYCARDYADQLNRGDTYDQLTPTTNSPLQ